MVTDLLNELIESYKISHVRTLKYRVLHVRTLKFKLQLFLEAKSTGSKKF